jgi:hypothetical protein
MSCEDCEKFKQSGDKYNYRWKNANVELRACSTHASEIMKALDKAQSDSVAEIRWVDTHYRLPEMFVEVVTLLFDKTLCSNSVQYHNVTDAAGGVTPVEQWYERNLQVTHWLEGVPPVPETGKETRDASRTQVD